MVTVQFHVFFFTKDIIGSDNNIAEVLPRLQMDRFTLLALGGFKSVLQFHSPWALKRNMAPFFNHRLHPGHGGSDDL